MAGPNSTAYSRPDIGEMFSELPLEATASSMGMIGLQLAPTFEAGQAFGVFPKIPDEAVLEDRDTKRAPKGGYARSDWEFGQDSFVTEEHGAEELIDDNLAATYRYAIDYDRVCAARAQGAVLRNLEKEIADAALNTGTGIGATAVTTPWSSHAAATPVNDVKTEISTFEDACGLTPNVLAMSDRVLRELTQCAQIIDRVKYWGGDDPKMMPSDRLLQALAAIFEIEEVVVAKKMRNSALKGQAVSYSKIWGATKVGLYRVARTQDLEEPCFARTFHWSGDGSSINGVFDQYRDESKRSDVMRFRHQRKFKLLKATLARLLTGVTA